MKIILRLLSLVAFVTAAVATAQTPAAPAPKPDASAAIEKKDNVAFRKMHDSFLARGKQGPIGVLFLGDSITQGWTKAPHIWEHFYAKWQPANFGIGGDQTQHVIWRIENGELDGINPKVVVLMLGTNNTGSHDATEIAAADRKIVAMIRQKLPQTKVLILSVFPRGPRPNPQGATAETVVADAAKRMAIIKDLNTALAQLDDGQAIRYLDITAKFLGEDGKIPSIIMPDQLHPNAAGYQLWAEAMQPTLQAMMQ